MSNEIVSRADLVESVSKSTGASKVMVESVLKDSFDLIARSLKKGHEVSLRPYLHFSVSKRAARKGRNPATGESLKIPASKAVRVRAFTALKSAVKPASKKQK